MESRIRGWQQQWRKLMGLDPSDPPPYEDDFSLHFEAWDRSESDILRLLDVLEAPAEVVNRLLAVRRMRRALKARAPTVPPDPFLSGQVSVLRSRLARVRRRELDESPIRVFHGDWQARRQAFAEASLLTEPLDDALFNKVEAARGRDDYAAAHFLAEPLYQLTTYSEPRNYVLWGYVDDVYPVDPYEPALDLWKVGAQAGEDDDGVFLFVTEN
jgi:hypothetical protein